MRFLAAVLLVIFPAQAFCWGPEGHRVIADLARDHLTSSARRGLVGLLGNDDLAAISTWADEIRHERPETYGWHFVDIPWNASGFDEQRDCYHPSDRDPATFSDHHNCVVDRINIFERVLANPRTSREERIEALKFLVHFVADLHQPLHAIGEARGGNDIHVLQFGSTRCGRRACDLHGTWDFGLIQHAHRREHAYVASLEQFIARNNLQRKANEEPAEWANESFRLAHEVWLGEGAAVDESYYRRTLPIVDQQMALGGLRLARMLNQALGK